jgi:hypothetical protein
MLITYPGLMDIFNGPELTLDTSVTVKYAVEEELSIVVTNVAFAASNVPEKVELDDTLIPFIVIPLALAGKT